MASREEILQRYGAIPKDPRNKTKKKAKKQGSGMKIIDDTIGFVQEYHDDEESPVIVNHVDFESNFKHNSNWEVVEEGVAGFKREENSIGSAIIEEHGRTKSPSPSPESNIAQTQRKSRETQQETIGNRRSPTLSPENSKEHRRRRSPSLSPDRLNSERRYSRRRSPSLSPDRLDSERRYSRRRSPSLSPDRLNSERRYSRRRSPSLSPDRLNSERMSRKRFGSQSPSRSRSPNPVSKETEASNMESTIYRDRTGRIIDMGKKEQEYQESKRRKLQSDVKKKMLSAGVVQSELHLSEKAELEAASRRGLSVYADDVERDEFLKEKIHWGDRMAKPSKKKKRKNARPMYEGHPPPNRFGILPGYRWDGIDRSNGFEVKVFTAARQREHDLTEYHKWATEDM
jgi:pre-mRNA-splicing factor CWC26